MSRIKVKFPNEKSLFETSIPIRIGDVNYGGHVGNDSILSIVHESRVQMLKKFDYSEMDAAGVGLIMADVAIAYKGESFYGDVLNVTMYAEEFTSVSFDLLYDISTTRNGETISIAHAKTGMVCFDYDNRKVTAMPEQLKSVLKGV
ncbi:MAG: acyl-CoA thioesterase [Chitinophagales bacterium]|nr:acyl-CoA thioesterase [Chitinophagaceae bacterium]MCB9064186.1 acyl-CoA thioesterase [Chitinophagales bacterium]